MSMTTLEIQAALKKRGITQKQLAVDLGVSEMTVSKVINKTLISDRVMRGVAAAIQEDPADAFEYYNGPRLRKTSKAYGQR